MKPRTLLFGFLALLTVLRLVYITQMELVADEAYYYLWSQHLDLSYYSKGPGVAFAIRLGTELFGANEFGVRCLSPLLSLGTSLVMYFFARRLYGESVALWTVLTMNVLPIFNVGSLVMTIDPLSIFFWAAALYTFWLALERSPRFSWFWPFTGFLIGLGFLAKYTNAMELLSILLILASTRKYRCELLQFGFYFLLLTFALCTIPVILWNHDHAWITLTHLRSRGNLDTGFAMHLLEPFKFLLSQLGVYSPLIFIGLLMALWWSRIEAAIKFRPRFLVLFALPLLVMYGLLALKKAGQANWTAPAFISLGILASALWHDAVKRQPRWKPWIITSLAISIAISLVAIGIDIPRSAGIPIPYKIDPTHRLRGWQTVADVVNDYRTQFETQTGKPAFIIGDNYQTSSLLSFYLPNKRSEGPGYPPVFIPESQDIESEFSFWPSYDLLVDAPAPEQSSGDYYTEEHGVNPFIGRNALYVTDDIDDTPPSALERGFQRVEMVKLINITRYGLQLRQVRIFACYNYHSVSL